MRINLIKLNKFIEYNLNKYKIKIYLIKNKIFRKELLLIKKKKRRIKRILLI